MEKPVLNASDKTREFNPVSFILWLKETFKNAEFHENMSQSVSKASDAIRALQEFLEAPWDISNPFITTFNYMDAFKIQKTIPFWTVLEHVNEKLSLTLVSISYEHEDYIKLFFREGITSALIEFSIRTQPEDESDEQSDYVAEILGSNPSGENSNISFKLSETPVSLMIVMGNIQEVQSIVEKIGTPEFLNPKKTQNSKVYLLSQRNGLLKCKQVEIDSGKDIPDMELYYGSGMNKFHEKITNNLKNKTKGVILLHGLPGSGKTNYIRYLINEIQEEKRVLLVPKTALDLLADASFTQFLIDLGKGKKTVLVVEDCESIIAKDARENGNNAVSTLLNVTDGVLNDIIKVQVILTFNCPIEHTDPALRRRGRMIGAREFGLLPVKNAREILSLKGLDSEWVTEPILISDLFSGPDEYEPKKKNRIGFGCGN